jgi:hypothetical protein
VNTSHQVDCPHAEAVTAPDSDAQQVLDLIESQQAFVKANLSDHVLRQVFVLWATREISFLYTDQEGNGLYVSRDDAGQWSAGQKAEVALDRNVMPLELAELRYGPERISQIFEQNVPDLEVGGLGVVREDCELRWYVGGFVRNAAGKPIATVDALIFDATGEFQLRNRQEMPAPR